MVEIDLPVELSGLSLRIHEDDWVEVLLRMESRQYALGGDKRTVVISRLLDALTKKKEEEFAGNVGNVKVQWILTLSEKHSTLYKGIVGSTLNLYVELADTSMLGPICLTEEDKKKWVNTLTSIAQRKI